jgi:hypothetical protein
VIEAATTSMLIHPDQTARADGLGNLVLEGV